MGKIGRMMASWAVVLASGLGPLSCEDRSPVGSSPSTTVSATSNVPTPPTDTGSGQAFRTVSGKVKQVEGAYYDVEEYSGTVVRLHVGKDTVKLNGDKKPGDSIRAEVTKGGHANSIQ